MFLHFTNLIKDEIKNIVIYYINVCKSNLYRVHVTTVVSREDWLFGILHYEVFYDAAIREGSSLSNRRIAILDMHNREQVL